LDLLSSAYAMKQDKESTRMRNHGIGNKPTSLQ